MRSILLAQRHFVHEPGIVAIGQPFRFRGDRFDYVITVCDRARATCPVFPGSTNTMHWGLDDPSEIQGTDEEKLAAFRRTETEVSARLRPFIEVALRAAGRPRRPELEANPS